MAYNQSGCPFSLSVVPIFLICSNVYCYSEFLIYLNNIWKITRYVADKDHYTMCILSITINLRNVVYAAPL